MAIDARTGQLCRGRRETEIENSPSASFTPAVFVMAKHHALLHRLALDSIGGVKRFQGELVKNHKGQRDIQRILAPGQTEQPALFLKRNWKPYAKDGLKSLFTRGAVWSQSRVEWENALALQRAGICVAEPIAFGEECGWFRENFSFIITAKARGEQNLQQFIATNADRGLRRRVFDALARVIRTMHDAGLASPDLFTRHIFLDLTGEPRFCLIDMARLDRRRRLPPKLRARDLAALHVTAPLRWVTVRERLRFLRTYGANAPLRRLIQARAAHLLRRKKFAEFHAP